MPTNQNRITITLSDENLKRLGLVKKFFGLSMSAQIQSLVAKYSETEYGKIDERRLTENDAYKA